MGFTPFVAHLEPGRGATTIALVGELDMGTASVLERQMALVETDGSVEITIDLRGLTFIDSSGLHAFLAARDRAKTNGRRLIFTGANSSVRRLFELIGQESLLNDVEVVPVVG
jgi:anti-sigma B factor antagonist